MTNCSLDEVAAALKSAQRVLVVSHYNPDADAYGSSLGLMLALKSAGKIVRCINETGKIERFDFFPGFSEISSDTSGEWDLLAVCDCGSFSRVGETLKAPLSKIGKIVNIDHHVSNDLFGTMNYVVTGASSTSEVIYDILQKAGIAITKDSATCLFAGIVGDTGSFRYSSTSPRTFVVARELCDYGASPADIGQALFGQNTIAGVKLQSDAVLSMNLMQGGKIAEVVIPKEMIEKHGAVAEDIEGLAEKLRDIKGVEISACIRQDGSLWRISLRSGSPKADVSKVAMEFGGGGHIQAAAFRWSKPVDQLLPRLRQKLEEALQ